jgi:hypothetical protein
MLIGKTFKLEIETLGLTMVEGRPEALTIPVGAIIKVVSWPPGDGDQMADVLLEGQTVRMFAVDVKVRGTEIVERERGNGLSASA